jgi:hypothetical protein
LQLSQSPTLSAAPRGASSRPAAGRPFLGLIDAVIVQSPTEFDFDGAIASDHAQGVWTWMVRDLAPDLIDIEAADDTPTNVLALESLMPELLARAKTAIAEAESKPEAMRRLRTAVGGDEVWSRLPVVITALRCRGLLEKAQAFGRAANSMADEAALALALQSMPLNDQPVAALLFQAAVGQVTAPARLIMAAIRIAGVPAEAALGRAGFFPLIDAIFAHAQAQTPPLMQSGTFSDMDLICRSVDRFHRLMRSVTGYVELVRNGRWAMIAAALTKSLSDRLEPKLRDVAPDINQALRRREGTDRLDADQVLSALNGMYLLATVRDSRDSLAVNAVFDQTWSQVGQALEIHIERLLLQVRQHPGDKVVSARLDAALKMAEVRFGADYADAMRRAKGTVERRA